jgi:hypothetical protein
MTGRKHVVLQQLLRLEKGDVKVCQVNATSLLGLLGF